MGIITWLVANWRFVGAIVIVGAFAWGAALVKGKFDRAADADRIEAQATADVAAAKAKAEHAQARLEDLKDDVKRTDEARAAADARVHEREEGYVSIIETLKKRAGAASPHGVDCSYGPDARRVLDDAWHGRAGAPSVSDAAAAAHGGPPAAGAAGGADHHP